MSDESIIAIRTASDVASIYGLAVYQILSELKRIGIDVGRNDALEKSSTLSLIDLYESKKIPCKVINVRQMYLNWLSSHDGIVFELQVKETIRQNIIENEWDKERRNKIDEERRIKFEKDRKESQRKDHKESERLEKKYKSNGGLVKLSMAIDLCADALGPNFVCNIIHECLSKRLIEIVLNKENIEIENIKLSLFLKFNYILCVKENHDYFFWSKLDRESIRNLEKLGVVPLQLKLKNQSLSQGFYDIKSRYSLSDYSSIELSTESLLRIIFKQIRGKNYTSAMLEIIFFLLSASFVREFEGKNVDVVKSLFPLISSIFIETNKMDLVFKLNTIDTSALASINTLSIVIKKCIEQGYLDEGKKLLIQLSDIEPLHPLIQSLQNEINRLKQRNYLKNDHSIDFSSIDNLSGVEFENLLLDKFSSLGFKVESTIRTRDFGADLIIENTDGTKVIIQCKRFKNKVNLKAVQEVVAAVGYYGGDAGIVITNNLFLNSAIKLAESHDIELWDGDSLVSFLSGDLSFSNFLTKTNNQ